MAVTSTEAYSKSREFCDPFETCRKWHPTDGILVQKHITWPWPPADLYLYASKSPSTTVFHQKFKTSAIHGAAFHIITIIIDLMAVLHHALAIPGYVMILVVLWGWLPIFLICWVIRKLVNGPMTPDEEAQQSLRSTSGWQGPDAPEGNTNILPDEEKSGQEHRSNHRNNKTKRRKEEEEEAEDLELRRRAIEKKRRAKQVKTEQRREGEQQQQQQDEPRWPEQLRTHESRHHRPADKRTYHSFDESA